ncbi:hypothetical protein L6Q21_02845 [Sandaracinobacter sp. RS1-74]|uniref:hypothetical protein n=1 Tax=Sandaracinobacteroides sayramensis TaxID=2913411 RepID=UPI001EDB6D80|nr:hypothetical protein [Sandaracinobacteroides sayramensis]MCG2839919.1 hypothetical protein [Sandaracinobacteroides sayramensis]
MAERIRERDLIIPALKAAVGAGGEIQTTALIEQMTDQFEPEGEDAKIIQNRSDSKFSQKVRNLVSHRDTSTSMFSQGYATYHPETESIRITDLGREFLDQGPDE